MPGRLVHSDEDVRLRRPGSWTSAGAIAATLRLVIGKPDARLNTPFTPDHTDVAR